MGVIMHDDVSYSNKGDQGITPNISATATVDSNTGTPAVQVVKTGPDETPSFAFNFTNLKGAKGDKGDEGTGKQVELTYAEYQALINAGTDDPDTEYFINDLEVAGTDYIETPIVTALTGATSLTITNSYITPTSRPRIFAQPVSCKTAGSTQYKVKAKISSITNGSLTLSFPALTENTEFKVLINAPEVSGPYKFRLLSIGNISDTIDANGEKTITFDFTSQMADDEMIISMQPYSTGVVKMAIRIFRIINRTTCAVTWQNLTSSAINPTGLGCQVTVARVVS